MMRFESSILIRKPSPPVHDIEKSVHPSPKSTPFSLNIFFSVLTSNVLISCGIPARISSNLSILLISLLICCPDNWTDDVVAFIPEVHQQYNQELLLPLTNFCYRFS
nr:MAG TPA: hypothetical protein [Siphoviridae sp. ctoD011]